MYAAPFTAIQPLLSSGDLAIGNLEGPLLPNGTAAMPAPMPEQCNLTGDTRAAGALARAGFDLLSVANNHSLDSGLHGLETTQAALLAAGIAPFGFDQAGRQQPVMRDVRGLRIAFLAYTAVPPNVGTARVAGRPYVAYLNPGRAEQDRLAADIGAARRLAPLVIVMMHWGSKYEFQPTAAQRRLAEVATRGGATRCWLPALPLPGRPWNGRHPAPPSRSRPPHRRSRRLDSRSWPRPSRQLRLASSCRR